MLKPKVLKTFGIAGTFSFFPGKKLGASDDTEAIITDDIFANKTLKFSNLGALKKHYYNFGGINNR